MYSIMEKFCKQAIELVATELKKDKNKRLMEDEVLDPVVRYIGHRLYPYVICVSIAMSFLFLLALYFIHVNFKIHLKNLHNPL